MADLYTKIETASRGFVTSTRITPDKPYSDSIPSTVASFRTSNALHSWRPNYFVANNPRIPAAKVDNRTFTGSFAAFLPALETLESKVHNIVVDTRALTSAVQVSLFQKPKGSKVALENDVVFILTFKEVGDEVKIIESIEYIDGAAVGAIGEALAKVKA